MKQVGVLLTVALLLVAAGCGGASDPEFAPPEDPLDESLQALDDIQSVMVRTEATSAYSDEEYRGFWDIGFEEQEILYSHYKYDGPHAGFTEELVIQKTSYLRADDGQWYVVSPDREEAPGYEPRGAGVEQAHDYYQEIVETLEDPVLIEDGVIDSEDFFRYEATFEIPRSGIDFVSREGVRTNTGSATLWLHKDTYLPRKVELQAVVDGMSFDSTISFVDYDLPVLLPDVPLDALPFRDYGLVATVPCSGSAIADCLPAQTGLESASTEYCGTAGKRVCLVPQGRVDPDLVLHLADYYRERYDITVLIAPPREIREDFVDEDRGQVSTDDLLLDLLISSGGSFADADAAYIGVTAVDVYRETGTNAWVFGARKTATTGERYGVISTFRMKPEFWGEPADDELFRTRVRKMASKYVGMLYFELPESDDPASPLFSGIWGLPALDALSEAPLVSAGQ